MAGRYGGRGHRFEVWNAPTCRSSGAVRSRSGPRVVRATIAASGLDLPLWSGEWGYSTYDPSAPATRLNYLLAVSLERQASWLARMVLVNRALGLAASVIFKDRDAREPDPGNIEDHLGLMSAA